MDSVTNAILLWLIALAILVGVFLIIRSRKTAPTRHSKAVKDAGDDIAIAPHRMDRLRHVHDQVKIPPRAYDQQNQNRPSDPL